MWLILPMSEGIDAPIVGIITDFGLADGYVSEIKGALLSVCSVAQLVDITDLVPPGDVMAGAYILGRVVKVFPVGTIFLAVVDPGVGSARQAVVVRNSGRLFVGPDNGLLGRALDWSKEIEVRVIGWADAGKSGGSYTFHGRDLFAPVAGRLAAGTELEELGVPGELNDTDPPKQPLKQMEGWVGEVVHIDRFGNIATNLPNGLTGTIEIGGRKDLLPARCYGERPEGEPFWLPGSDGCLEVAMNRGSASELLGVKVGDPVRLVTPS